MNLNSLNPIISMDNIGKKFGKVSVLKNIKFDIFPGEVHILAGENGAGKSTLMKILSGVHSNYDGTMKMYPNRVGTLNSSGIDYTPTSPLDANRHGVSIIHQELSLIPSMDVKDNLFLGRPLTVAGFIQDEQQSIQALKVLKEVGLDISPYDMVEDLPISMQQLIEISKAISIKAKVIIMDEPSSSLNNIDVEILFSLIKKLKEQNCGIVYISHKMDEIERLADRITVLRDGEYVGTALAKDLPIPLLINWMVGREMTNLFPKMDNSVGNEKLRVENVNVFKSNDSAKKVVDNVSFSLGSGEILGIAGLQGCGSSELLLSIFGAYNSQLADGIYIDGKEISISSPSDSIKNKIALLTNDRKATGLVLSMSIIANVCMAGLKSLTKLGWRRIHNEISTANKHGSALQIHAASFDMEVNSLSGGNQQKVAIGKWLQIAPQVLLLDEPTRGIDVGAKHEIYSLMNEWTNRGISIVLITSEMPELIAMSDRILVMHRGEITAEYKKNEASAEDILEAAMGKEKVKV